MDKVKVKATGTRLEVFRGNARHTSGGLKKADLIQNGAGKLVSKNASAAAKKNNNLVKAGYTTEKGKFGAVFKDPNKTTGKKSPVKKNRKSPGKKTKKGKDKEFSFF
jgi:hypothetical protein